MFSSLHTKPTHFRSYAPFSTHKADSLQILCPLPYTQSLLTSDHTSSSLPQSLLTSDHTPPSLHAKLTSDHMSNFFSTQSLLTLDHMSSSLYTKLTHFTSYVHFSLHKNYFRSYVPFSTHKAYSLQILNLLPSTQSLLHILCPILSTQNLLTSDPMSLSLHTKLTHFRSYICFSP